MNQEQSTRHENWLIWLALVCAGGAIALTFSGCSADRATVDHRVAVMGGANAMAAVD